MGWSGRKQVTAVVLATAGLAAGPVWAEITVPSGQVIELHEMFLEAQENGDVVLRLRYLTPEIAREGGARTFGDVEEDFLHLCEREALPLLAQAEQEADQIVISMMDRVVEFGASDSAAIQFFEMFRHNSDTCIWEGF